MEKDKANYVHVEGQGNPSELTAKITTSEGTCSMTISRVESIRAWVQKILDILDIAEGSSPPINLQDVLKNIVEKIEEQLEGICDSDKALDDAYLLFFRDKGCPYNCTVRWPRCGQDAKQCWRHLLEK